MIWFFGILFTLATMLCINPWGTLKVCGVFAVLCGLCVIGLVLLRIGIVHNI